LKSLNAHRKALVFLSDSTVWSVLSISQANGCNRITSDKSFSLNDVNNVISVLDGAFEVIAINFKVYYKLKDVKEKGDTIPN
jgi:hypothetical protein